MTKTGAEPIAPHVRPIDFAGVELLLDLIYIGRKAWDVELEAFVILLCVSDATMRPFVLDPATPPEIMCAARPPDSVRGSISRRTIADKTGLPRETVRRKVAELAAAGHVSIDTKGQVRIGQRLGDPAVQAIVEEGHRAILRYFQRLTELGVDPTAVR